MNFNPLPNGMAEGFVLIKKCEEKKTKKRRNLFGFDYR